MQFTAARSSRINKNRSKKTSQIPLLPEDVAFIKSLEEDKNVRDIRNRQKQVQLQYSGPAKLEWHNANQRSEQVQGAGHSPLLVAVRYVLSKMWISSFPEKGISLKTQASIKDFWQTIPRLVSTTHLTAIFPDNATYIDREVMKLVKEGVLRKFIVSLASIGDMVMESTDFYRALDHTVEVYHLDKNANAVDALTKLKRLFMDKPENLVVSLNDLEAYGVDMENDDAKAVFVQSGFLTLQSGRHDSFNISVPSIGSYVKLITTCRKWLLKYLEKMAWKEALATMLETSFQGNKIYWKEFKGLTMEWALFDGFGGGWVEPFTTPVGVGWKLTGKT